MRNNIFVILWRYVLRDVARFIGTACGALFKVTL
jgi:hypothetical protein